MHRKNLLLLKNLMINVFCDGKVQIISSVTIFHVASIFYTQVIDVCHMCKN